LNERGEEEQETVEVGVGVFTFIFLAEFELWDLQTGVD
jgi:hypothetical protein